jgi:hypothetical protein
MAEKPALPGVDGLELASTTVALKTQDHSPALLEARAPPAQKENGSPTKSVQEASDQEEHRKTGELLHGPLASYDKHGMKFIARLANIEAAEYGDKNVYMLHFTLDFMNPFHAQNRIRGAKFIVKLIPTIAKAEPCFLFVRPTGDLIEVSQIENSETQRILLGLSANSVSAGEA